MIKRIFNAAILLVFLAVLVICVLRMPRLKTDSVHDIAPKGEETVTEPVYEDMSQKELLVLAYDGDSKACYRLGVMYDYGTGGVEQNFSTAKDWYITADAYDDPGASAALGYIYLNGCGVDKDASKAKEYFDRAIKLGNMDGYAGLGRITLDSKKPSDQDRKKAISNFKKAADAGNADGMYFLGYCYEKGFGKKKDYDKAFISYRETAASDSEAIEDKYAINSAYTRMGILYMKGNGVKKDYRLARDCFKKASDGGFAMASYYMGILYEEGYGVTRNYTDALEWFETAAQQDYAPALNEIGYMYFNGYGVDTNYSQAVYYQKLAAALGLEKAQVNLGYLYENGYGVEKNYETALDYYEMADATGYAGAKEAAARVRKLIKEDK